MKNTFNNCCIFLLFILLSISISSAQSGVDYYFEHGIINKEQARIERSKDKLDYLIINQLENIRKLSDQKIKEKKYRDLFNALKYYDTGKISLTWRIKQKIGLQ